MVLIYFVSTDGNTTWEAEAYEAELGIGIEPGTTNEELIRRFGQPQDRESDGGCWIYNLSSTDTMLIFFNEDGTVHETRLNRTNLPTN